MFPIVVLCFLAMYATTVCSCNVTPSWLMPQKALGTFSEVCVACRNDHKRVQDSQPRCVKTQLGRKSNDFVHCFYVCVCVCVCVWHLFRVTSQFLYNSSCCMGGGTDFYVVPNKSVLLTLRYRHLQHTQKNLCHFNCIYPIASSCQINTTFSV